MGTEFSRQRHGTHPYTSPTSSSPTHRSFASDDFDTTLTFDTADRASKSSSSLRIQNLSKYIRLPRTRRFRHSIPNGEDTSGHINEILELDGDKRLNPKYERSKRQYSLMNELINELLHGKFKAPVHSTLTSGGKVLDIGCGDGCWSFTMASLYPHSKIHGLDLTDEYIRSNPLPTPDNFTFTLHDMHGGLPYASGTFDFVFSRCMGMYSTREQWPALLNEFQRVTKPGGYIELLEGDLQCYKSGTCPTYKKLYDRIATAMRIRAKVDPVLPTRLTSLLGSQPGLVFVTGNMVRAPMGWDNGLGVPCRIVLGSILNSLMKMLLEDGDEDEDTLAKALDELAESKSYLSVYYAYAQKSMFC